MHWIGVSCNLALYLWNAPMTTVRYVTRYLDQVHLVANFGLDGGNKISESTLHLSRSS